MRCGEFDFETAVRELRAFEFADDGLGMFAGHIEESVTFAEVDVSDG